MVVVLGGFPPLLEAGLAWVVWAEEAPTRVGEEYD